MQISPLAKTKQISQERKCTNDTSDFSLASRPIEPELSLQWICNPEIQFNDKTWIRFVTIERLRLISSGPLLTARCTVLDELHNLLSENSDFEYALYYMDALESELQCCCFWSDIFIFPKRSSAQSRYSRYAINGIFLNQNCPKNQNSGTVAIRKPNSARCPCSAVAYRINLRMQDAHKAEWL